MRACLNNMIIIFNDNRDNWHYLAEDRVVLPLATFLKILQDSRVQSISFCRASTLVVPLINLMFVSEYPRKIDEIGPGQVP